MKKILLILCVFVLAACDSGNDNFGNNGNRIRFPGEGLPELTASQISQVRVFSTYIKDMKGITGNLQKKRAVTVEDVQEDVTPSAQMVNEKIEKAFTDEQCIQTSSENYENPGSTPLPTGEEVKMELKVDKKTGGACPVLYSYNVATVMTGDEKSSFTRLASVTDFQTAPAGDDHDIQEGLEIQSYKKNLRSRIRKASDGDKLSAIAGSIESVAMLETTTYGSVQLTSVVQGRVNTTTEDGAIVKKEGGGRVIVGQLFKGQFEAIGVIELSGSTEAGQDADEALTFKYYINARVVSKEDFEKAFGEINQDDISLPLFLKL